MNFPPLLWGAILDRLDIDLPRQHVIIKLHVINSSFTPERQNHTLELRDVSEFRWYNSIPGPWNYAEVSEVHVRQADNDSRNVSIMLWSEDAGLSMTAKSVLLNGAEAGALAD